eukprot:scaffold604_cov20-Tisochrysis_lutea.AAC.1
MDQSFLCLGGTKHRMLLKKFKATQGTSESCLKFKHTLKIHTEDRQKHHSIATEGINIYEVTVHSSAWQCIGWRATDWCTPVGADQCGKTLSTDASSIRLCNSGGY